MRMAWRWGKKKAMKNWNLRLESFESKKVKKKKYKKIDLFECVEESKSFILWENSSSFRCKILHLLSWWWREEKKNFILEDEKVSRYMFCAKLSSLMAY